MSFTDIDPPRRAHGFGPDHGYDRGAYHAADRDEAGSDSFRRAEGALRRAGGVTLRALRRGETWLDARGRGAWIAATVIALIFAWPIGLALLAYAIWSKRMFTGFCSSRSSRAHRFNGGFAARSSGNSAFDAYRTDTLRRLEEEQIAFESFLERLRAAKDKQEFDSFMDERVARARAEAGAREAAEDSPSREA